MIKVRFAAVFLGIALSASVMPVPFGTHGVAEAGPSCTDAGRNYAGTHIDQLANCSRGGDYGNAKPIAGNKVVKRFYDRPCLDRNRRPSYEGIFWHVATDTFFEHCVLQPGDGSAVDSAVLRINAPKPTANFGDKFLTGAEVTFSVPEMTSYVESLRDFPGATMTATPKKMFWDFGDGTTSTEISPTHTYRSKTPDPKKPDDNVVTVAVTGTWQVHLQPPGGGAVEDLGEVTLTGQLTRPIVEVWSAQTEPRT